LLFFSSDLSKYVHEVDPNKQNILLLNKADLLSPAQRKQWKAYFDSKGVQFFFFSAKLEKELQEHEQQSKQTELNPETASAIKSIGVSEDGVEVLNCNQLVACLEASTKHIVDKRATIGMVGYPNVGKSSTINVLCNAKKVAESATPGKTKHFQTILLNERIMLCDCPGLVFPSFIATKADMVCNGLLPIDQLRDHVGPVSLVAQRIPRHVLEKTYGIVIPSPEDHEDSDRAPTPHELLQTYGKARGFMASHGLPDEPRSARYILKDFVGGKLLFCHPPPGINYKQFNAKNYLHMPIRAPKTTDSIAAGIEEMRNGTIKEPVYKGKRKVKRRHNGAGQNQINAKTRSKKGYAGVPPPGKMPTNVRL